jgi:putative ABC transport system permease protein
MKWQFLLDHLLPGIQRALRRPGFTIWTALILGLTLGANVAAFTILYGYLFRPLPYLSPERLLTPREQLVNQNLLGPQVSVQLFNTLRQLPEFHDSALYIEKGGTVALAGIRRFETYTSITPTGFSLLGVKPLLGRALSPTSGMVGGPKEVVLSYAYWQQAFGGSPRALGSTLEVDGVPMQVVGVMPQRFIFPRRESAFWVPFVVTPELARDRNINPSMLMRLPSGRTLEQVNALLRTVRDREVQTAPPEMQGVLRKGGYSIDAVPYRRVLLEKFGGVRPFWGLFGATFAMLLLAVANVLNLTLARQRQRLGELQLRGILGATLSSTGCMLLGELLPLLFGAGLIASMLAMYCVDQLRTRGTALFDGPFHVTFDSLSIAYLVLVAALIVGGMTVSSLVMILGGRLRSTSLQELGARSSGGRAFRQAQRLFAAAQMCVAMVLMICSLLFARSLLHLLNLPLNFRPEHVTVAEVMLPTDVTPEAFWQRTEKAFDALPGVRSAALSSMVPFGSQVEGGEFAPYGRSDQRRYAWFVMVSPGFFETLGVPSVAGRVLGISDELSDSNGADLSEALARSFFGRTDVVGEMLAGNARIIGVVPTLRWQFDPGADKNGYAVYVRLVADSQHLVQILLKSNAAPGVLYPAIRKALAAEQPNAAIHRISTLSSMIREASGNRRAVTELVIWFGVLAFLVATFGMYAVVEYATRLRMFEFAIREVLGATRGTILRMVLREATLVLSIGAIISFAVALLAARALSSWLYGVGTLDPTAYLGSLALIGLSAACASSLPTLQATRASPADIMRK